MTTKKIITIEIAIAAVLFLILILYSFIRNPSAEKKSKEVDDLVDSLFSEVTEENKLLTEEEKNVLLITSDIDENKF